MRQWTWKCHSVTQIHTMLSDIIKTHTDAVSLCALPCDVPLCTFVFYVYPHFNMTCGCLCVNMKLNFIGPVTQSPDHIQLNPASRHNSNISVPTLTHKNTRELKTHWWISHAERARGKMLYVLIHLPRCCTKNYPATTRLTCVIKEPSLFLTVSQLFPVESN